MIFIKAVYICSLQLTPYPINLNSFENKPTFFFCLCDRGLKLSIRLKTIHKRITIWAAREEHTRGLIKCWCLSNGRHSWPPPSRKTLHFQLPRNDTLLVLLLPYWWLFFHLCCCSFSTWSVEFLAHFISWTPVPLCMYSLLRWSHPFHGFKSHWEILKGKWYGCNMEVGGDWRMLSG